MPVAGQVADAQILGYKTTVPRVLTRKVVLGQALVLKALMRKKALGTTVLEMRASPMVAGQGPVQEAMVCRKLSV